MNAKKIDAFLKKVVEGGCVGNGLRVMKNGVCVYENAFGMADLERNLPMSPDTVFRAYSISKPVVATAALMLLEKGAFTLSTPLADILPEFRSMQVCKTDPRGDVEILPATRPILMRHVLNQTAGFTGKGYKNVSICGQLHQAIYDRMIGPRDYTLAEFVETIAAAPLAFEPGTHFHYGNGYEVLARVIEVLSGDSFGGFLEKNIFGPLGMADTGFRTSLSGFEKTAKLYNWVDGAPTLDISRDRDYMPDATFESGSGGLLTTLADYSKFENALVLGQERGVRLLKDETIALFEKNSLNKVALYDFETRYTRHGNDLSGYGYSFGVRVMMDPVKAKSSSPAGEFGWYGMSGSFALFDRANRLSIVYNHQTMPYDSKAVHFGLRELVYEE